MEIDRVIQGVPTARSLTLEVMVASSRHVDYLSSTVPGESGLFFLRVKDDPAYHGFVLPQSFVSYTNGAVSVPTGTHAQFLEEWNGQPLEALEATVIAEIRR